MKKLIWTTAWILTMFSTAAPAQENFVQRFLDRYRPPLGGPPSPIGSGGTIPDATIQQVIRQGSLPIALEDVIRLMIESNLDVRVGRFSPLTQEWLLQTLYRPFEPTLKIGADVDSSSQPAPTILVPTKSLTHNYNIEFTQAFTTGTRVDVTAAVTRTSDNNQFNTFNPAYFGVINYSVTQNLMQNFGRDINMHSIRVSRNAKTLSDIQFEMQMIDLVTNAQDMYWDLVGAREDLKVKDQALKLAQQTLSDNEREVQLGALAPIEIVQTKSNVASREQQLVVSTFAADQLQDRMKRVITSAADPAMVLANLVPSEPIHRPDPNDVMPIEDAIKYALENRPEVRQAGLALENNDIDLQFARNQLMPSLTVTAAYRQAGIGGRFIDPNTGEVLSVGGLGDTFGQIFGFNYSGYNLGFNLSIPLSNKSAQAEYSRVMSTKQESEARRTALTQSIALQVRNAHSAVEMNRAVIGAAEKTRELAEEQLAAEQRKLELGGGQIRFVLQEQQNVATAQSAEVQSLVNYAKAVADFDKAIGRTLKRHNIEIDKQLNAAAHP